MILALLLSLPGLTAAGPAVQADEPPVRVEVNEDRFRRGDRARVYVETARDGYLVVLHADPDGRVRVLFPLDPTDDDFVRGGGRFEIRGRGDREAFFVDAEDGAGTVLAAFSPDPLRFGPFVRGDHWDYRLLGQPPLTDDRLAGLLDILQRMAGEAPFEYDVANYVVGARVASGYGYRGPSVHLGYGYPYRFSLFFGYPYRYSYFYPFYDPFFYDPFFAGSYFFYDPFCFRRFWGWSPFCHRSRFFFHSTVFVTRPFVHGRPFVGGFFNRPRSTGPRFVMPRGAGHGRRRGAAPACAGGGVQWVA